ncbi:MAG TPA: lytic murein transglycosylase [Candidatus Paceibacterota bacterium]|nr:lytic murein transglycosylase [Candidatus Paceibacterota bacterium]
MKRPLKPRVLGDISRKSGDSRSWSAFGPLAARVNLAEERVLRVPLTKTLRVGIIASAAVFLLFGSALAPTLFTKASGDGASATSTDPVVQRTALETQLSQLEGQIDQYQGQIASYATQGKTLSGQIAMLNDKIASISLQIQATHLTAQQLDSDIAQTQAEITATQTDIAGKKAAMGALMQELYQNDQTPLIQTFLEDPQVSDLWNDTQDITLAESDLRLTSQQISGLQSQLQNEESQFQASQSDVASAAAYQQAQTQEIADTKSQEAQLLAETQGQESKYQALLVQTQASAAQIRSQIFQLLGGGQLSFEDAYQYASLASNATGIDPAFILAILDRESALGQNLGQCNYKSAMSPSDQPLFLVITQSLGLDPNEMFVSCPNTDGTYGGAMGPAQFEPSTWNAYASTVQKITGSDPPSPWNDADAFVAAALYLKDSTPGCQKAYATVIGEERCVAAKYYAGSRWQSYLWTYGEAVVEQAQTFASDIQTITAGAGSGGSGNGNT